MLALGKSDRRERFLRFSSSIAMILISLSIVAAVLAVVLLVWHRTPWGRRRPMPQYAVLSLVAHLLLAIIAAAVRVVAWPPGAGEPEPIRVTVLAELPREVVETLADVSPTAEQAYAKPVAANEVENPPTDQIDSDILPVSEPTPPQTEPLEAPSLAQPASVVPLPSEVVEQVIKVAAVPSETVSETPPVEQTVPQPVAEPTPTVAHAPPPTEADEMQAVQQTPTVPKPSPPALSPAAPFADRLSPERLAKAIEQGGSRETEQAVENALAWLADAQSADGRWNAAQWGGGRETEPVLNHDRGRTGAQADTGISGLALLAFLGAGNSHQAGGYQQTMADGLNFLIRSQSADGNLAGDALPYAQTYCHSMATFALAESLAMTGDQRLRPAVDRAVDYFVRSQDLGSGGWRYRPGQQGDLSQLGWVIMALRSAELGGAEVPTATWERIEHFVSLVGQGRHGGLGCYKPGDAPSRAMTAEALYCRQILGLTADGRQEFATREAVAYLGQELPGDSRVNLYHWYYASLALHHAAQQSPATKATWQEWNNRLQTSLLPRQESTGAATGSWPPNTVWAGYGGRVYSTAMATMCLEVYYRYHVDDPARDPWVAAREVPNLR